MGSQSPDAAMALDPLPAAGCRNGVRRPGGAPPPHPPARSAAARSRILDGPAGRRACSHLEGGHRCAQAIRLGGVAGTEQGTPRSPAAVGLQDREGRRLPLLVGSHPHSTDPRSVVIVGEAIPLGMAPAGGDRNREPGGFGEGIGQGPLELRVGQRRLAGEPALPAAVG